MKPRIGQGMALGKAHVSNVTAVFHYQEVGQPDHEVVLIEGTHYSLDAATGRITLLPHALWDTLGYWRAGDREEPLLYKGQVKSPQDVSVTFDYWEPVAVSISTQKNGSTLTIDVTADEDGDIPIAVTNGKKIGSFSVPVSGGAGQHVMTIGANVLGGTYTFSADTDVLDPTWNVSAYRTEKSSTVEVS